MTPLPSEHPVSPSANTAVGASPRPAVTACCDRRQPLLRGAALQIDACVVCGTLWATHSRGCEGRPWDESYVPEYFAQALAMRRRRQAAQILDVLQRHGEPGRLLDYGCGQGVFLQQALQRELEAFGCDLDLDAPMSVAPRERVIQVPKPWAVPEGDWHTVVMLDVLEHHADPVQFLRTLGSRFVLLKLPNATGPAARAARLLSRTGRHGLLQQLFLVGENFPHQWLATRRGVREMARQSGFDVVHERCIAEFGSELPRRFRQPCSAPVAAMLSVAGAAFGAIGRLWSDASVVLLRRSAT